MAARTAWTPGNGVGLTWSPLFNVSDLNASASSAPLPTANSVLSTIADIANGSNLDMFMDISLLCAIASSTVAAGANFAFWIYQLQQDASTYGDGQLTAGVAAAKTPAFAPCGTIPLFAAATQTTLEGSLNTIIIPPGSFRMAIQNNSGFTLTAGTQTVKYRTYNINLNN